MGYQDPGFCGWVPNHCHVTPIVVMAYGNALILILVLALEEPTHTALVEFVVKVYVVDN